MSKQNNTQSSQNMPPRLALWPMISAYYVPQLIYVVAKLGIADILKDGVKNCDELASATGTNAQALYRLMRALASVGVFAEKEQGYFGLTPVAVYLQSDIPDSIRWAAIMFAEEQYKAWGELLYSIKTGASAFEYLYGMELYEYYAQNLEQGEIFHKAMTSIAITREDAAIAPETTFWEVAQDVKHQINELTVPEKIFQYIRPTKAFLSTQPDPQIVYQQIAQKGDLCVTNLGRLNIPQEFGSLYLEAIYGPIVQSSENIKIVGVTTLGGKMFLTLTFSESVLPRSLAEQIKSEAMQRLQEAISIELQQRF